MEIRNQIVPYDLTKCFVQMPWLACGMRGEGSGFVVAHGAAEDAHWKAAASLEELHRRSSFGAGFFTSQIS